MLNYVNLEVGEQNCSQSFVSMPQMNVSICTMTHNIPKEGQICIVTRVTLTIYTQEKANRLRRSCSHNMTLSQTADAGNNL